MKASVLIATCCTGLLACEADAPKADAATKDPDSGVMVQPMQVLDPAMDYAGRSLEAWGVEYIRWFYSQATCQDTTADTDGSLCGQYQTDPDVFFLDRADYANGQTPVTTRPLCHVPHGKALVVPVAVISADNAGMAPLPDKQLQGIVASAKDSMREFVLRADGEDIGGMQDRAIGPVEFDYHVPPAPNFYSCRKKAGLDDSVVEPSYLAGYFAVIAPPELGEHELEYASVMTIGGHDFSYHVKVNLTVDESAD